MHLLILLAVLAIVAARESAAEGPVDGVAWRLTCVLGVMGLLCLAANWGSLNTARGIRAGSGREEQLLRRFRVLRQAHLVTWSVSTWLLLFPLEWVRLVRENWGLGEVCLVDEIVILLPVVLPLLLSWGAFCEVEHAVEQRVVGRVETKAIRPGQRLRRVLLQARQDLGLLLIPALGVIVLQDLADQFAPAWRGRPAAAGFHLVTLIGLIAALPVLLKILLPTHPMSVGPLRDRLEGLARRVGVPIRGLSVWETGDRLSNAAVTGLLPGLRYVFMTDALVRRLEPPELEAILLHELAHLRRRHLFLRLLVLISPLWLWLVWQAMFPVSASQLSSAVTLEAARWGVAPTLLVVVPMAAYVLLALAWHARLLEHDADLWAVEQMPPDSDAAAARFIAALNKLSEPAPRGHRRGGWLHPSLAQRQLLVERVDRSPEVGRRFRRRLSWLHGGLMVVTLGAPLLLIILRAAGLC